MTKVKVPKRIAGVKVPKKLRKQAKKMLKASASPVVQDLALAGLSLAATRMLEAAAAAKQANAARPAGARPDRKPKGPLHGLDLAALLEAAAAEGARRFLDSWATRAPAAAPAEAPAPKRRRPGASAPKA